MIWPWLVLVGAVSGCASAPLPIVLTNVGTDPIRCAIQYETARIEVTCQCEAP